MHSEAVPVLRTRRCEDEIEYVNVNEDEKNLGYEYVHVYLNEGNLVNRRIPASRNSSRQTLIGK